MTDYLYCKADYRDEKNIRSFLSSAYNLPIEKVNEMFSLTNTSEADQEVYLIFKTDKQKLISLVGAIRNEFGYNFCYFAIHVNYRRKKEIWNLIFYILEKHFDFENISSHAYTTSNSVFNVAIHFSFYPTAFIYNITPNRNMYYLYRRGNKFNFKPCFIPKYYENELNQVLINLNIEIANSSNNSAFVKENTKIKIIAPSSRTHNIQFILIDQLGYNLPEIVLASNSNETVVLAFNMYDYNLSNSIEQFLNLGYRYCGLIFNLGSNPRFCLQKTKCSNINVESVADKKHKHLYELYLK